MLGEEEIAFVTGIQDLSRSKLLFCLNSFLVEFMLCIAEALLYIPQGIKNQIISFGLTKETHHQMLAVQRYFQYFPALSLEMCIMY